LFLVAYDNGIKWDINSKRNYTSTWNLNNTLLNDQWVIKEIRKEIFKIPKIKWKQMYNIWESLGDCKDNSKRYIYN
jgi:hypothetical protein